ncbi:putative transferase [Lupinus albus]|uniref:Putative transferase n=1 Tax=Lupinus albus TaxID=3870 RepID=A0A6A4PLF1_LUPAL|nr:putative transferase [Lupinus albus]
MNEFKLDGFWIDGGLYECCFLWVDVSLPVLHSSLSARVDRMIEAGQLDEVRQFFEHSIYDYTRGVRRAIGLPEFDEFLREEHSTYADQIKKKKLLEAAIAMTKVNNCKLASRQVQKINRLYTIWKNNTYRLNATQSVFNKSAWDDDVAAKGCRILQKFLYDDTCVLVPAGGPLLPSLPSAMTAVTH